MLWLGVTCDSSLGSHISPVSVASKGFPDTSLSAADPTGTLDEPESNVGITFRSLSQDHNASLGGLETHFLCHIPVGLPDFSS